MTPKIEEGLEKRMEEVKEYMESFKEEENNFQKKFYETFEEYNEEEEEEEENRKEKTEIDLVNKKVLKLENTKKEILKIEFFTERIFAEFIRLNEHLFESLSVLVDRFKLSYQHQYDHVCVQWLNQRFQTMILKLK